MIHRSVLGFAAAILLAAAAGSASAARVAETELRFSLIQMDADRAERGQTVEQLIQCLRAWNPGERRRRNAVEIARLSDDVFTVTADLRSRSIFHFQVTHEYGNAVALLRRVEYVVPGHGAYQQVTDADTKRALVASACAKP
ncbi:MAG: hypothetical protein JO021_06645 [Alphaproteobacteria bacterium]|nr:hypothetical protein [Alphaproteobacteria bacterium]